LQARPGEEESLASLFSLEGQVALVTGAGSAQGIGFAVARLLAEMGAQVSIAATGQRIHQRAAELAEEGHIARGYIADLTDRPAAQAMIRAVESDFGRIDILVNNAGMSMEGSPEVFSDFAEMSDKLGPLHRRNLTTCYNVAPGNRHVSGSMGASSMSHRDQPDQQQSRLQRSRRPRQA
jgi:3-oxoacyl-[acyl-carrier protein] reductase